MNYDPSQWPVLSRLLDEILEQLPEARERWINELPPELGPQQAALRQFLSSHAAAETADFLGTGPDLSEAFRALGTEPVGWKTGDAVGPYVLEAQIGHGGMGTVWRASRADGALKRPVALKLPFAGLFGAELGRRLLQERDILASLTHPGIARLYDAGSTTAGQPYIALEYVEGVALTEFCDRERLSVTERLQLFLDRTSFEQLRSGVWASACFPSTTGAPPICWSRSAITGPSRTPKARQIPSATAHRRAIDPRRRTQCWASLSSCPRPTGRLFWISFARYESRGYEAALCRAPGTRE